jgi:hypothetical protein
MKRRKIINYYWLNNIAAGMRMGGQISALFEYFPRNRVILNLRQDLNFLWLGSLPERLKKKNRLGSDSDIGGSAAEKAVEIKNNYKG